MSPSTLSLLATAQPNLDMPTTGEPTLLILTHSPSHASTELGLHYAKQFCQNWQIAKPDTPIALSIFCYGDAAYLANRLIWLAADMPNFAKDWQQLAIEYNLKIQVCVTTALARGIVDSENAQRHQLEGDNLANNFELVGLGELAMLLHQHQHVYQF